MKQITGVYVAPAQHWVGDGLPVRSMFSYQTHGQQLNPFLLLDYAGPYAFPVGNDKRGVGEHPHRGFETVTIVYTGEVEHRGSTGRGGVIDPGDMQWMTAGAGILHEEFHSEALTRNGGELKMIQLWVNLPAKDKMTAPGHQSITAGTVPTVALADGAGQVRVIAGQYDDVSGPVHTFSPPNVWDLQLNQGRDFTLRQLEGWSTALVVLEGEAIINGSESTREDQLAILSQTGDALHLEATAQVKVLLMAGEPLQEPIVDYGPFVMDNKTQIAEVVRDFNSGRFGQIQLIEVNTISTLTNFNGARPAIDVNDTAMLLIDHQSGLFQTVSDMPMPELCARAAALAKMASLVGVPVITTASVPQGPNGPLIPEIHENVPHAEYIARKGEINAWGNPEFVAAVRVTGRKTLVITGTITSVCMAFPAIAAVADGYKVFAVIDAFGTYSKMAQEITLTRVVQASVVPTDTTVVASELQRTWNRPDATEWAEMYTKAPPAYQLLIESYSKTQDVVKNSEQLDSQR